MLLTGRYAGLTPSGATMFSDERRPDEVRPGRHVEADFQRIIGCPRPRVRRRRLARPAQQEEFETLTVETEVELLWFAEPTAAQARRHDVLGVEREVMPPRRAAAASERQVRTDPTVLQPESRDVVEWPATDGGQGRRPPAG